MRKIHKKMWIQDQTIQKPCNHKQKDTCDNNIGCLCFRPPRKSVTMGPITCLPVAPTMLRRSSSSLPATPVGLVTTITSATTFSRIAASSLTTSTSNYWRSITLFRTIPLNVSSLPTSITLSGFKHRSLREVLIGLRWTQLQSVVKTELVGLSNLLNPVL